MTIDRASLPILPIYARWPCFIASSNEGLPSPLDRVNYLHPCVALASDRPADLLVILHLKGPAEYEVHRLGAPIGQVKFSKRFDCTVKVEHAYHLTSGSPPWLPAGDTWPATKATFGGS